MTKRQLQPLTSARSACEWLGEYIAVALGGDYQYQVECLLAEFKRLDKKEQKQIRAGRRYGKLGAEHGKKGGRPKKNTQP